MKNMISEAIEESQLTKRWGTWILLALLNYLPFGIGAMIFRGMVLETFKKEYKGERFFPDLIFSDVFKFIWNTLSELGYTFVLVFTYGIPIICFFGFSVFTSFDLGLVIFGLFIISPLPYWFMFATYNAFRAGKVGELFNFRKIFGQFSKKSFSVYGYSILVGLIGFIMVIQFFISFIVFLWFLDLNHYDPNILIQSSPLLTLLGMGGGFLLLTIGGYLINLGSTLLTVVFSYIVRKIYLSTLHEREEEVLIMDGAESGKD